MGCCCCCCGGKLLWGILLAVSLVIFALGFIFTYAAFPAIIEGEVSKNLDLWNPDSEGRLNFEIPPVPVYMKFMLFTVENSEDATKGEKIRFNIVGPYSYKEDRHKVNIPMFKDSKIDVLAMVNNETLVPILWLDEQAVIDQENIDKIRRMVVTPILATETSVLEMAQLPWERLWAI
eukprot:maker-scaffold10_size831480-snap-gene-1.11 protein:Tk01805 transcript:maker-scaffold10_size831480-snap-gene-1.11-mRNA-1 annotation:"unnamed protein product"